MSQQDNINPTPQAVAAMYIYHDEYAAQNGGSMDFWRSLPPWKVRVCEDFLEAVGRAATAHGVHIR